MEITEDIQRPGDFRLTTFFCNSKDVIKALPQSLHGMQRKTYINSFKLKWVTEFMQKENC